MKLDQALRAARGVCPSTLLRLSYIIAAHQQTLATLQGGEAMEYDVIVIGASSAGQRWRHGCRRTLNARSSSLRRGQTICTPITSAAVPSPPHICCCTPVNDTLHARMLGHATTQHRASGPGKMRPVSDRQPVPEEAGRKPSLARPSPGKSEYPMGSRESPFEWLCPYNGDSAESPHSRTRRGAHESDRCHR
jgi:hypothetical protein